jgi:Ni,Fe-hydrogenase III large subunit
VSGVAARGARKGRSRGLLRLIARALPPQLDTFVLPGPDIARAVGLDLDAAGCRPATTPRHSTVLLVVGELPAALLEAAVVVFAQMTRPRVIVALDSGEISPLPTADVIGQVSQDALETAIEQARQTLREGSWSAEAEPFEAEGLVPKRRKRKKKSPASPRKSGGNQGSSDGTKSEHQAGMHHDQGGQGDTAEAGTGGEGAGHGGTKQGGTKQGGTEHGGTNQGGMKHAMSGGTSGSGTSGGGMSGGGMETGFMSMVRLTQHLQRSADGLPMERVQAPFGPFFRGLPSGLDFTLWLDGDTVAKVDVAAGAAARGIEESLAGDSESLHARLARLDPLAPQSYRLLGWLAHRVLQGSPAGRSPAIPLPFLVKVEIERVASHLNWLAGFAELLGYRWLSREAAAWQHEVRRCRDAAELAPLEPRLHAVLRRVRRTPLLARKLAGLGRLTAEELEGVSGPAARASGLDLDARSGDPTYQSLGFEPVRRPEGDAWARLLVRLAEVEQSVALVLASRFTSPDASGPVDRAQPVAGTEVETAITTQDATPGRDNEVQPAVATAGEASARSEVEALVETPRGTARLLLNSSEGASLTGVRLETPSSQLLPLLDEMVVELELADALLAIGSLDISPWEADR